MVNLRLPFSLSNSNSFSCTDAWESYLPTPLVILTEQNGDQNIHIAPEAFSYASAAFPDQIPFWQEALPGDLKGKLESVSHFTYLSVRRAHTIKCLAERCQSRFHRWQRSMDCCG